MMYFALVYEEVVARYAERRAPFREEHLGLLREAHARGELVMAGALDDPPNGALLIFRSASPDVADAFARRDPYVTNGVVTRWRVRPWNVVVGQ
jgi:uncharacterized protein YciI